jgi:hypothetical protein
MLLLTDKGGYKLPSRIKIRKTIKPLVRDDYTPEKDCGV